MAAVPPGGAVAVGATCAILRYTQRAALGQPIEVDIAMLALGRGGQAVLSGTGLTAWALLLAIGPLLA